MTSNTPPPPSPPTSSATAPEGKAAASPTPAQLAETTAGRSIPIPATAQLLDDWLSIAPDGTITVRSGKVELGTGIRTALAQIVADELDVPLARIVMVMGDTARTPNEGYTAGSKSIQQSGAMLRAAAAEARRALLAQAAARLGVPVEQMRVRDGVIFVPHPATTAAPQLPQDDAACRITYGELMGGKSFDCAITGTAPTKPPQDYAIVGTEAPRLGLLAKFTGAPSFVQQIRLPGMLHARIVRPPRPGATLLALDEQRQADVQDVQQARIVRLGNFVAVLAEREEQAVRAAERLRLTWDEAAPFPPEDDLYEQLRTARAADQLVTAQGDVVAAMADASLRCHAVYQQPFQAHASLGPSCAVAEMRDGVMMVWCSSQGVYPLRGAIADLLEMPVERVRVIYVEGAGCYGQNGADDAAAEAALLARETARPVRVQWSREEEFVWEPKAPAMLMEVSGGLDPTGHIAAWDYAVWTPTHANRPRVALDLLAGQLVRGQSAPPREVYLGGERNAVTNYIVPAYRVTAHWLQHMPLRCSSMRSLGAAANTFANESFMDELAAAAGADPVAFRLQHLRDPRAVAVIQAAAQRAQWGTPLPPDEGRGIAFARYENSEAYVATVVHLSVDCASGVIRLQRVVVAHDCGLIVNPDGVRNQIEGNVIQSASRTLKEAVHYDAAQITSRDWETYPILTFTEVPEIESVLLDRPDEPAVGAGEPATVTTAPAIANAVYAASGVRLRRVPFTPRRVREALACSLR